MTNPFRYLPGRQLPSYRHRPGQTPHPVDHPEGHSHGQEPRTVRMPADLWALTDEHLYAVDLFRAGYYWEAHEAWEALWRGAEAGPIRELLQALIQASAALLHLAGDNLAGARTVAARADEKLAGLGEHPLVGIEPSVLRAELAAKLTDPAAPPPRLELVLRSADRAGLATDRWVQGESLEVTEKIGYQVLRTPSRPDYYSGHGLVLDEMPREGSLATWLELAAKEARGARDHLWWEDEGSVFSPGTARALRSEYSAYSVLTSSVTPEKMPIPAGYEARPAESDDDWERLVGLSVAINAEVFTKTFENYTRWHLASHRNAFRTRDCGRWWIVTRGKKLVASLGLYESDVAVRFQDVQTDAEHRRRGIASALMTLALRDAAGRRPHARAVIVADHDGPAERIYRRLGFATHTRQHMIVRIPAAPPS